MFVVSRVYTIRVQTMDTVSSGSEWFRVLTVFNVWTMVANSESFGIMSVLFVVYNVKTFFTYNFSICM